jgi:Mg-chelatase subunit ChlD/uncharacterized protein involved in exopolysaccharide biosynthesis
MNEEPPTPLDSEHDTTVEARIVSWVLGEASAFEAAELERLCEERPELLVFRRRMRHLHGLLTQSEASEPDLSWQLPAEKRRVLDEIFGEEKTTPLVPLSHEPGIRRSGRRTLFAIAACAVISFFVIRLVPWKHEAEVVLEVKPQNIGFTSLGTDVADADSPKKTQKMSPQFFGAEFEKIKRRESLAKVVEKLGLASRWKVDMDTALRRLRDNTVTENVRDTNLIAVKVRDTNEDEAKEIVREITNYYRKYRSETDAREAEKGLAEFNKAVRDQEDKVEENRKVLASISKTKGIIYRGNDSYYGQGGVDEDSTSRGALESFDQLQKDKMQLETQINSLLKISSDQLMVTAAGLDLPYNVIKSIYPQYLETQRSLETLKLSGLGEDHPDVKAAADQAKVMKMQMDEGVVTLRETLKTKLNMTVDSLKSVAAMKEETREESITRGLAGQDYVEAKRELEASQQTLESMKLKKIGVETALKMTEDSVVIHEEPELPPKAGKFGSGSFQVASSTLAKNREPGLMRSARQQQLGKNTVVPATEAVGDVALPEIADSTNMESIPADYDPYADSPRSGLALAPSRQPGPRVVPTGESKAETSSADAATDSFSAGELAEQTRGKKIASASVPPVLATKQPAPAAAPESTSKLSDLAQTENVPRKDADLALQDVELLQGASPSFTYGYHDTVSPTGGVAQGDLETLKRLGMTGLASAENPSTYLLAGVEHHFEEEGELTKNARDVRPSHLAKPSEVEELTQDEKDLNQSAHRPDPSTLPELMEEISTAENPYSTFSLNISDTSFQLAKAALAKGERPDPASIKPEQFYNAVDYGDPMPASNEPVAATIEQTAHPIIPGRNLVRVALRTGSVGRSAAQPLRLTLLVDQSGSMVRDDRRAAMEQALAQLGTLLTKADLVTVIGFSRTPHLLADGMSGDQATELGKLVNQTASEGGTNLEEAMKLGAQLATRHQLAGAQNRIVLFTDGAANLGDAKPERLAQQVKDLRQKGIAFDIAGIGADGLNDRLLSDLARNGNGRYYVVSNEKNDSFARQLAGAFRPAAENVKIQVIFNPKRVSGYKLIGFEKDRLKAEDFRNDSVDAAELAADEAGVAIYQVEPLAEGSGEIGEISVRFRDTSSGEMVERSWSVPYDAKATAFDRATPSMQLAGLSMLAAEKLRGGPLAAGIDFKQLSGSTAFVKQFYGSSPRITDMLHVIEALK